MADDNEGNVGVVEFYAEGAVAAVSARAPERCVERDHAIDLAPPELREAMARICDLPLLQEGRGVSAVFWTLGEFIQSSELWRDKWLSGAELFGRELLPDSDWASEGRTHYDLTSEVVDLAIAIAGRADVRSPLVYLTEQELMWLVPPGSAHELEARDLLTSDGLFETIRRD